MKLVKNNLGFDSGLEIFQDKEMFNYSVDTIMLGNFVTVNSNVRKILDIGANNGALSIFVAARKKSLKIDAIEIQSRAADLCKQNVSLNKLENQINVINDDFNHYYLTHCKNQYKKFDLIMCNPPFYKVGNFLERKTTKEILIARSEYKLNIDQIIKGSSKIIKQKGYLTMIHKPERFIDIVISMRKYGFEPKRIQFIYPRVDSKANLVMIEARYKSG
jgi:tRNA1Val (adenine37-N6)-methyltransferase